jgi:hypothetical protein
MDLRRIVQEVEARKHEQLARAAPPRPKEGAAPAGGVAASILLSVRDRMLREDPQANVASLTQVIEPDRAVARADPPATRVAAERMDVPSPRQAVAAPAPSPQPSKGKDDFLPRYLLMSAEFERRYALKGWTELVRKKCSAQLRR